jgi:hypothetical protein
MSAKVIDSLADRMLDYDVTRFVACSNDATLQLVEQQQNANTRRMTDSHLRLIKSYLASKNDVRELEDIPPAELDLYLAQFFLGVRKSAAPGADVDLNDSSRQYEPSTLAAMHSSFHRYLAGKQYPANLKEDSCFKHSRDVLGAKMKELKKLGKGNKPHAAEPFTTSELEMLAEHHLLGSGT